MAIHTPDPKTLEEIARSLTIEPEPDEVARMMRLVGDLSGHGDSCKVEMVHQRRRLYHEGGEDFRGLGEWAWDVWCSIAGTPMVARGHSKSLARALADLAKDIPKQLKQFVGNYQDQYERAKAKLDAAKLD